MPATDPGGGIGTTPSDTTGTSLPPTDPDEYDKWKAGGGTLPSTGADTASTLPPTDPDEYDKWATAHQAGLGTVLGKSAAHGAASAPASLLGTPAAFGKSMEGVSFEQAADAPYGAGLVGKYIAGPIASGVGKLLSPFTSTAQGLADQYVPAPTEQEIGPGKLRHVAAKVAEIGGNMAAGAALGAGTGALAGRVVGIGAEDAALGQLGTATKARDAAYAAAGPQILSHPAIDTFMQSSVPEIQDATTAANDALNIRAARLGVTPTHMALLKNAVANGNPQKMIQTLGLSADQADAALAALPGGPTTVSKFDLVRQGLNDAINSIYTKAKTGSAAPADLARAKALQQWVKQVTPIADQQVGAYQAARLAHGQVAGLENAADYLGSKAGGAGDLGNLATWGTIAAVDPRGMYPKLRAAQSLVRLMTRGGDASADLTPQGARLVNAAKWMAARRNAATGAAAGAVPGAVTANQQ